MFLKLTDHDDEQIIVNSDVISYITPDDEGTIVFLANPAAKGRYSVAVKEKFEDIKRILKAIDIKPPAKTKLT